jgi:hypothetical protein
VRKFKNWYFNRSEKGSSNRGVQNQETDKQKVVQKLVSGGNGVYLLKDGSSFLHLQKRSGEQELNNRGSSGSNTR